MSSENQVIIGLAGLGTVGKGLVDLLEANASEIERRTGKRIVLKWIAVRDTQKERTIPAGTQLTTDPVAMALDPEVQVIVELMGGLDMAENLIRTALKNNKSVVTANKALLAQRGEYLFSLAEEQHCSLAYEASVAGAIPIVQTLKESLAGNHITSVMGILNGTSNYILSEMSASGLDFATALRQAQELGFAEADPTLDIDGQDAAHKLILLIRLAWGVHYPFEKLDVRGIRNMDPMDIRFAAELGYSIKLLGGASEEDERIEAGVCPYLVPQKALLARVDGAFNAIKVNGNAVGSLFLHGLGAGSRPTASAVLGDLIALIRTNYDNTGYVAHKLPPADILPPDDAQSPWYVRLMVPDDSGVLRDIAGAMAMEDVSIAQVIQKPEQDSGVPIVFMTHKTSARAIKKALAYLEQNTSILHTKPICYRVQEYPIKKRR